MRLGFGLAQRIEGGLTAGGLMAAQAPPPLVGGAFCARPALSSRAVGGVPINPVVFGAAGHIITG